MQKENIIVVKSFDYAVLVTRTTKFLENKKKEYVISKQFLRAGISIGANISEAQQAESSADFIHKLSVSLKEANECKYWIKLLFATEYIEPSVFHELIKNTQDIINILVAIIKTSKKNKLIKNVNKTSIKYRSK